MDGRHADGLWDCFVRSSEERTMSDIHSIQASPLSEMFDHPPFMTSIYGIYEAFGKKMTLVNLGRYPCHPFLWIFWIYVVLGFGFWLLVIGLDR
ncbi:hypothetical protein VTN00DRAFT_3835 [Thermoascus crustaceus]|uniref:uncharacterized protein n=1 Tax=Thermoascus crustaceus TaxID=5088 RepID=UPI00374265E9